MSPAPASPRSPRRAGRPAGGPLVTALVLVALAVAGVATAPPVAGAAGDLPPLAYDGDRIRLRAERTVAVAGLDGIAHRARWYRNDAYRCGRTGHYSHLVVERADLAGQPAPLWVMLHGGGVGYYGEDGHYHKAEGANDEESIDDLLGTLDRKVATAQGRPKDTVVARRLAAGWRVLLPSMCDHDLYSGVGTPYPHNPHWPGDPDTVDGLLATMAAIDTTVNGNAAVAGFPSTHVFLHGQSAGAAGAYSVSYAFARAGIELTGAVLDAYLVSERLDDLFEAGVTPQQISDPEGDYQVGVPEKIGPFVSDPALFAEQTVAAGFDAVPLFDLVGSADPFCAGQLPPVEPAVDAGYDSSCTYVHGLLADAVAAQPEGGLHRSVVLEGDGHQPTNRPGPIHDQIDAWMLEVLATAPPPPWPPGPGGGGAAFVDLLYRDFLGRPADGTGSAYWAGRIATGTPRGTVAAAVVRSAEAHRATVDDAFRRLLGRPADAAARAHFAGVAARSGVEQVERALLGSGEYRQRAGAELVDALYRDVLGRSPDAAGRAYWAGRLAAGLPVDVMVRALLGSDEGLRRQVHLAYERYLARPADPGGAAYWAGLLRAGLGRIDMWTKMAASSEYARRA